MTAGAEQGGPDESPAPPTRVLLDTDLAMGAPGSDIDDGFALSLAVADPRLRLGLVTTVNGNTDVDTATRLSRELLQRLHRDDVPVVRGAAAPLLSSQQDRRGAAQRSSAVRDHAAVQLAERVLAEPGEITIVAIGPLTNVALATALEPAVAEAAREIVVMGGVYLEQTNVAAMPGEFNFWADPEAADIVLASGARLRLVGLDVTRRVRLTKEHAERMAESGGDFGPFAGACAAEWIDHLARTTPGDEAGRGSCALHDPLAVAVVAEPEIVSWQPAHVTVETAGRHTRGVAVADLLTTDRPPAANCAIAAAVDADRFAELFLRAVEALP